MLKKILIVAGILALTGCATHQQANTAVGAGVGAVIGHAIGGSSGAVVGGVVGTAIGSQHPVTQPAPVYGYPAPVYVVPDRRAQCQIYNERIYNCGRIYDPIHRNHCWNNETNNYNRCLYQ